MLPFLDMNKQTIILVVLSFMLVGMVALIIEKNNNLKQKTIDLLDNKPELENIKEKIIPGPIVDTDGNQVGMHKGIAFYTIGQRKGIGIPFGKPFYVVKIDKRSNSIIVGEEKDTFGKELIAHDLIWTSISPPKKPFLAKAKIRYTADDAPVLVIPQNGCVVVKFKKFAKHLPLTTPELIDNIFSNRAFPDPPQDKFYPKLSKLNAFDFQVAQYKQKRGDFSNLTGNSSEIDLELLSRIENEIKFLKYKK